MSWCCSARIHIILTIVGPCVCPHALIHARRPHSRRVRTPALLQSIFTHVRVLTHRPGTNPRSCYLTSPLICTSQFLFMFASTHARLLALDCVCIICRLV